ncbi:GNAT family N-acetyltransferase [Salipiger marinus]|uniref:GNAT family N-acetyltransferase n=1 Tax=Salipiger marinus TaxID=555512 RepID=UPI002C13D53F|nr:GNAT family N-acetyltransferase [Salipiger manganoxidans]MEB3419205.1 GNAT family N-acetyltransferase [Salipiger manganoxidans]
MDIAVRLDDPNSPEARALLQAAHELMQSLLPEPPPRALSLAPLAAPESRVFIARMNLHAVGCCAMILHRDFAEIKRLYVAPEARRLGIAARLLQAVERAARQEGYNLLKLESGARLTNAHRLYARSGFTACGQFGAHAQSAASLFMEKHLRAAAPPPRSSSG